MAKVKGLYKRGGVWWFCYAGLDGRVRRESSRSSSHRVASDMLTARRKEVSEGKESVPVRKIPNVTFDELATLYSPWAERQRSFNSKQTFIKALSVAFGKVPIRRFTTHLVEKYQSQMIAAGRKPSTANRHIATLKHMFTKASTWDLIDEETLKRVRRVKLLEENNRRLRFLSIEECQTLIAVCPPHLRPIVVTALNTGMRKEEILSLEWDKHIDMVHGFILLDLTKNGERREIPINATLRGVFQSLIRRIDSTYVFHDKDGKRYLDMRTAFMSTCRRAGIKDFRFHDLRHTFASQLVMAGIDLATIKELLGHKDLTMTLRYAHLAPSHRVNALAVLDGNLNRAPEGLPSTPAVS